MAKSAARRATKVFFIALNVIISVFFLLGCLSPYINPSRWWLSGFTGLIFPYLLLTQLLFVIFWLFARPRWALLPFLCLLVGWKQISVVFAWHAAAGFTKQRKANSLRIVDWNIHGFNGASAKDDKRNIAQDLTASIIKFEPDVICMQEFNTATNADHLAEFKATHPYYYFGEDYHRENGNYRMGSIIFSRHPIVRTGRVPYPSGEGLIFADIVQGTDTIRIYTTHLQSFRFKPSDYNALEKIKEQEDDDLAASKSIYRKMKRAFNERGVQANIVHDQLAKSPYPSIVCGDFNDVPNSYTYFRIRGERQDAFLKKGFGTGRSYLALAPTLRIDYILPTTQFEIQQFDMIDEDLSDHIMLVTDLVLKK